MNENKKKGSLFTVLLVLLLIVGLGLLAYPTFADWWNNMHQSRAIAGYVENVANMDKEDYQQMIAEAEAYNRKLLTKTNRYELSEADIEEYNAILDVTGTGIMGYVEIPQIGVELPIYHGTDEDILQVAIGHIEGTSLPVGGPGTHTVISGHRGLPSAKLFTDIDQLEYGDQFMIQVLDKTLTYQVDKIRIVLPTELQDLEIEPDQDYCTLITCTPYGVNTHRLLVRGTRVENPEGMADVTADAMQLEPMLVAPLVAAPMLLLLIIWLFISTGHSRREKESLHVDKERRDKLLRNAADNNEQDRR